MGACSRLIAFSKAVCTSGDMSHELFLMVLNMVSCITSLVIIFALPNYAFSCLSLALAAMPSALAIISIPI